MSLDPRLLDILERYEDLQAQGQAPSLVDLCREHPDLLEEARRSLRWLQAIAAGTLPPQGGPVASAKDESTLPGQQRPAAAAAPDDAGLPACIQDRRVLRGGSFYYRARIVRSSVRNGDAPSSRLDALGFRPSRTLAFCSFPVLPSGEARWREK